MPIEPLNLTLADYEDISPDILKKINEVITDINFKSTEMRRLEDTCIFLTRICMNEWERNKCQ